MGKPYCPPPAKDVALVCMLRPVEPFTVNNGVSADCDIQSGEVTAGDEWTFTWSPSSTNDDVQFCFPDPVVDNDDGSYSLTGTIVGEDGALMVDWPVAGLSDTDGVAILDGSFTLNGVCYELPIPLCSGGDDEITIDDAVEAIEVVKTFAAGAAATYSDCLTGEPLDVTGWEPCPPGYQAPATGDAACASCLDEPEPEDPYLCALTECPECGGEAFEYVRPAEQDTEQSFGIGQVLPDGGQGVKFDTASADISPELQAAHQAIIDCINAGGVANTVITDQDGNSAELNLDAVGGDGNPQYFYGGEVVDGEPAGGKVRAMAVTCSLGDCPCAIRTLGCNDDRRDDLLEDILEELQMAGAVQEEVCFEQTTTCDATKITSRITTSPDTLDDPTQFVFSYEVDGVEIIPIEEATPPLQYSDNDYINGRADLLLAGLGFPYTWEVVDIVDNGEESTYTAILTICLPEGAEGGGFRLGSDWTQDSEPVVLEQTTSGTGILCTDKDTGESVLISEGEVVADYTIVDCPNPIDDILDHLKCGKPVCAKWQSVFVQMDNTGTSFAEDTEFNITNTDGTVVTFNVGPVAGWSDQVIAIAAAMDAAYDGNYDPRCTTGCGGLLPPPSDAPAQKGIVARYINGVHCPTDLKIPVKATATRASGRVVDLPFYVINGPEYRGWVCPDCCDGEAPVLLDENMQPVPEADLPACWFDCAETIPAPPLSECQFDVVPGNWCDIIASGDPEIDDEIVQSEIFITVATCGSEQTISYAVATEDGGLEPYEPVGSVADCETGEEPFVEPPPCPEGLTPEQVCVPGDFKFFMDNSLWDDGVARPANHLQNGNGYVIALFDAAGVELSRSGPLADPYFNSLLKAPFGDCVMVPVCANHTSPKGCAAGHVANYETFIADIPQAGYDAATYPGDVQNNVANPAQSEVWAAAWGVSCPGCGEAPAYVEIVDSTDPAWIGVRKNLIVWQAPDQIMFRSVDPCGGVYWQDCNGNPVPAPAGAKCAGPCPSAAQLETNSLLEQLLECMCAPCPEPSECPTLDVGDATYTGDQTVVEFPAEACQGDRGALPDFAVPVSFGPKDALAQCLLDADPSTVIRIRWNFDHQPDPSDSHSGFGVSAVLAGGAATAVALSDQVGADIGPATPHNGPRLDHWADFDIPLSDLLAGFTLQTSGFGTINEGLCETIHSQSVELSPDDVNLAAICDC